MINTINKRLRLTIAIIIIVTISCASHKLVTQASSFNQAGQQLATTLIFDTISNSDISDYSRNVVSNSVMTLSNTIQSLNVAYDELLIANNELKNKGESTQVELVFWRRGALILLLIILTYIGILVTKRYIKTMFIGG